MDQVSIGILLYPQAQRSAALGLEDLFTLAAGVAADTGVQTRLSVRVLPEEIPGQDLPLPERCDYLILPPSLGTPILAQTAAPIADWLRARHAEGSVLASICGGAFVLAETGLLRGRIVTTHWLYAETFQKRFPEVVLDSDRLLIDDGDLLSAGGLLSWTDLGLRLVERILGPNVMMQTARIMLIDPPGREQRYYSAFVPNRTHGDQGVLKVQNHLHSTGGREARLGQLVQISGLEERTLLRRFKKATGLSVVGYTQRIRVSKSQELLQFTREAVETIAWSVGYSDPSAFRKVFVKIVGLSPSEYRQRFHG